MNPKKAIIILMIIFVPLLIVGGVLMLVENRKIKVNDPVDKIGSEKMKEGDDDSEGGQVELEGDKNREGEDEEVEEVDYTRKYEVREMTNEERKDFEERKRKADEMKIDLMNLLKQDIEYSEVQVDNVIESRKEKGDEIKDSLKIDSEEVEDELSAIERRKKMIEEMKNKME